ncbi:chemotaxis protein CheW [Neptuniibacter marinus]|uniref:chemotaxis protein CheW n=1 Tax=Neptuniibacter marinus TaxID=1806670 RepID=UPI0009EECF6B|nr:chemotaxis protein CheW [Neptuniibacter marinus]
MGLESAAEHLRSLQADQAFQQKESTESRRSNQEEVVYHQLATFKVDNELYGIDVVQVKEVLRYSEITPVPGSDDYVLGIINLRGNVVTVIDTRLLFGIAAHKPSDDTRIIVVEYNEQEVVGLVVDSADEVINLPQNDIDRAPNATGEETTKRFVMGVCYYNNILIILLDIFKMLQSITPLDENEEAF